MSVLVLASTIMTVGVTNNCMCKESSTRADDRKTGDETLTTLIRAGGGTGNFYGVFQGVFRGAE